MTLRGPRSYFSSRLSAEYTDVLVSNKEREKYKRARNSGNARHKGSRARACISSSLLATTSLGQSNQPPPGTMEFTARKSASSLSNVGTIGAKKSQN